VGLLPPPEIVLHSKAKNSKKQAKSRQKTSKNCLQVRNPAALTWALVWGLEILDVFHNEIVTFHSAGGSGSPAL